MGKECIQTEKAPAAIGPYSQGITTGEWVFTSGQIPLDPVTGEIETDIQKATELVLNNLQGVLQAAGVALSDVVKTTVFLSDMGNFAAVNEVYAKFFPQNPPARSCVAVAALPRNVGVEIEAIAIKKG